MSNPLCPHCNKEITGNPNWKEIKIERSKMKWVAKYWFSIMWYCPHCSKVIGVGR